MSASHQYTQPKGIAMWHILWEFRVAPEQQTEFERAYGSDGDWAQLFAKSAEFRGTTLLRDPQLAGRYLTVDRWTGPEAFDNFKEQFAAEYKALDSQCEALTEYEMKIGGFEAVGHE
jgi:hypothetical protein